MDTITCLWYQPKLDEISIMCINSWLKLGYKVLIYTYSIGFRNEWINTKYDKMVSVEDGNKICPNNNNIPSLEFRADEFRFTLFNMNKKSSSFNRIIWCDTDQYLIRKIPVVNNFVSSQETLKEGAFKHKDVREIPNIGIMSFDGYENVDWDLIIKKGNRKGKVNQSASLKQYEKLLLNSIYPVSSKSYCPIHWAYGKDIYSYVDIEQKNKYGLEPITYRRLYEDKEIIGIHLWRQLLNKKKWIIQKDSIYNRLRLASNIEL